MVNKRTTKRVRARRATMRMRAKPVRRCKACLILKAEAPDGFECKLSRCPRRFEVVAVHNATVVE